MTGSGKIKKYFKAAAVGASVAAGIGTIGFTLTGQFEMALASAQTAIALLSLPGIFAESSKPEETTKKEPAETRIVIMQMPMQMPTSMHAMAS